MENLLRFAAPFCIESEGVSTSTACAGESKLYEISHNRYQT